MIFENSVYLSAEFSIIYVLKNENELKCYKREINIANFTTILPKIKVKSVKLKVMETLLSKVFKIKYKNLL